MYVRQLKKWKVSYASIVFMGGEVFLRDDFFDLLHEVKKYPQINLFSISSNGTLIDIEVAKKLKEAGMKVVQISMEGRKNVNDKIGGGGSFDYAKKAIYNLNKVGIKVTISVTVSKENIEEVSEMIRFGERMKVKTLGFRRITPLGNSKDAEKYLLSPIQTRDFYKLLIKEEKRTKREFTAACEMGPIVNEGGKGSYCPAGYRIIVLMPNGDAYPCRRLPLLAGNILKDGFDGIYYKSDVFNALRDIRNTNAVCASCEYFSKCRGGAKCVSAAYYNNRDPFNPDPQCWKIFKELPSKDLKVEKDSNLDYRKYDYNVRF